MEFPENLVGVYLCLYFFTTQFCIIYHSHIYTIFLCIFLDIFSIHHYIISFCIFYICILLERCMHGKAIFSACDKIDGFTLIIFVYTT